MIVYNFEKRFGKIAVGKGFLTENQLMDALKIQLKENLHFNSHRLIGLILIEKGWLNDTQVKEILLDLNDQDTDTMAA